MKRFLCLFLVFLLLKSTINMPVNAQVPGVKEVIQEQSQWCWAAVTNCILAYYGFDYSQCTIAEYTRSVATWHNFGTVDCCTDPGKGCNYWNYNWGSTGSITDILNYFGKLKTINAGGVLSIDQIKTQIAAGRPFIFRWEWKSGSGHFLVGYGISGKDLYYMNPLPGYGHEISNYDWVVKDTLNHTWTHSQTFCMPVAPENISGNTTVCQGSGQTWSVTPVQGATSYMWTLPSGWTGSSDSVSITARTGNAGGIISVVANNNCGRSTPRTLNVNVKSIDTTITVTGSVMKSNANPAAYQWINCQTKKPVEGASSQSFSPAQDGMYAVVITREGCTDTSKCHPFTLTGSSLVLDSGSVLVYPNPVFETLKIKIRDFKGETITLTLVSSLGHLLREKVFIIERNNPEIQLDMKDCLPGMYFIKISSKTTTQTYKVCKY